MENYILFAIPFFLFMVGLEMVYAWRKRKQFYRLNDTITNLAIGVGSEATGLFFKIVIFGTYLIIYDHIRLFDIPATWWSFLLVLLLYDFCYYWAHRMLHVVNVFWGAHVVHHSSEEYNLSVALRQSWFESLLAFFVFIPIPLLGFDPVVFLPAAALDSLYQFWVHTQTIKKLPAWYEKIFNTPSHHRVHHARNPKYLDKNYAGIFIFWDKLFGSFQQEEEAPVFGITTPVNSWNPVWANMHYYKFLFEKMKHIQKPADKIRLLFSKPGWMPASNGGTIKPPAVSNESITKYNAQNTAGMHVYLIVQFALIVIGLVAFMYYFETLPAYYQYSIFGIVLISLVSCGGILEKKQWVIPLEYFKLVCLLLTLNSYYYFYMLDWFILTLILSSGFYILFNIWFTFSWKNKWAG